MLLISFFIQNLKYIQTLFVECRSQEGRFSFTLVQSVWNFLKWDLLLNLCNLSGLSCKVISSPQHKMQGASANIEDSPLPFYNIFYLNFGGTPDGREKKDPPRECSRRQNCPYHEWSLGQWPSRDKKLKSGAFNLSHSPSVEERVPVQYLHLSILVNLLERSLYFHAWCRL